MKVKVFPYVKGVCMGNIVWSPAHPMKGGKFPASHPVGGEFCDAPDGQCSEAESIVKFRECGYWASCFPEGDGITWQPLNHQSDEQCIADIRDCFGWECVTP